MCGIVASVSPAANIASAPLSATRKLIVLENGNIAEHTADRLRIANASGIPLKGPVIVSQVSVDAVELGPCRHDMQKEVFEQPEALTSTLELIGNGGRLQPAVLGAEAASLLGGVRSVLMSLIDNQT